jgi:hypothetical protein
MAAPRPPRRPPGRHAGRPAASPRRAQPAAGGGGTCARRGGSRARAARGGDRCRAARGRGCGRRRRGGARPSRHAARSARIVHIVNVRYTLRCYPQPRRRSYDSHSALAEALLPPLPLEPLALTASLLPATCFKGKACQANVRMDSERAAAASREFRAKHSAWKAPARPPSSSSTGSALGHPAFDSVRAQSAASFVRSPISLCRPALAVRSNCRTAKP